LVESFSFEEVQKITKSSYTPLTISPYTYEIWKERCQIINQAIKSVPSVSSNVYRGKDMELEVLVDWMRKQKQRQPIYLGPLGKPAITSATWDFETAKSFLITKGPMSSIKNKIPVLLELADHEGVAIQRISNLPGENEVLVASWKQFYIEEILPLNYFKPAIYIKLKGAPVRNKTPAFLLNSNAPKQPLLGGF
jgi:hypothetical protein